MTQGQAAPRSAIAAGCIASLDPLVVVAKRDTRLPLGLASLAPERFLQTPSLHFIGLARSYEDRIEIDALRNDLSEAERTLPLAHFVMMANTPAESIRFSQAAILNILANELIFVDERIFVPPPRSAQPAKAFDAVYVARFDAFKRHELARAIDKLLLVYDRPQLADIERVKSTLPRAHFANHESNAGAYRYFSREAIRDLLHQASIGLCLSAVEGAMRASLEYRFCGMPVVSTKSVGGRDRYLLGPHVRVVNDDPDAVAAAVRELKERNFDPHAVREYVGQLIAFDRHNFLISVNKIVERTLGARDRFRDFAPFAGEPVRWRPTDEILAAVG